MEQAIKVINEDGTSLEDFPKNPLEEKWSKLYPPYPNSKYDDYNCMRCSKCPFGSFWIVPEEDLEIWNEYQKEILDYHRIHNPELYDLFNNEKIKKLTKS